MDKQLTRRLTMAGLGGFAGVALYGLSRLAEAEVLSDRALLGGLVLASTFFGSLLVMAGPLRLGRAAMGAALIAAGVTGLLLIASLRFETVEAMLGQPQIILSAMVLATVPLPFWIARNLGRWNDYPVLFTESWSIVVRYGIAYVFVGIVWGILFLSDALLGIVGLHVIGDLIDLKPVPFVLTGAVLGLGLAVVQELQDYVSPFLILRMLRLILPVVAVVTAVFLLALPVQGVGGLFGGLSVAMTMLTMAGAAATLVTTAVDQEDRQATHSAVLKLSTRAMAVLLPLLAAVGAWSIWLRVGQYGWTPARVFGAEIAVLGLGYGALYALAVLRGSGWMERIRQANVRMAFALMALAAISLTPILSAEAISARSHLSRFDAGKLPLDALDPVALGRWGLAGQQALAILQEKAKEPGQEALAERLEGARSGVAVASAQLLDAARAVLVLQPATATATRDLFLAEFGAATLKDVIAACGNTMPGGGAGCVMVVADLLPQAPGEEAILALWQGSGFASFEGLVQGRGRYESIARRPGGMPFGEEAAALIREWQAAPPAIAPAPINALQGSGFVVLE